MTDVENLPVDLQAVDFKNRTYLFYVNPYGKVSYLKGPDRLEKQGDPSYILAELKAPSPDTQEVDVVWTHENIRQIAVVSFTTKEGNKTLRLYYATRGDPPSPPILTELCSDDGEKWFPGQLGTAMKYGVGLKSTINAIVQDSTKQLKVYFTRPEDKTKLGMAYIQSADDQPGSANWNFTTITGGQVKW